MDSTVSSRSFSYVALSTGLHFCLAAAVATLSLKIPVKETIEVALLETNPVQTPISAKAEAAASPEKVHTLTQATPVSRNLPTKNQANATAMIPSKAQESFKVSSPQNVADEIEKSLTAIDTATPERVELPDEYLDSSLTTSSAPVDTSNVESDVESLQSDDSNLAHQAVKNIDAQTQSELDEKNKSAAILLAQHKADSEKAAQEDAQRRANERRALAQQIAQENKQRADAAAAKALANEKALLAAKEAASASSSNMGSGNGESIGQLASSSGVRSLEELRQLPGNRRPQYDTEDRLHRRQGEVSFVAYVSKEGSLMNFKILKSSGHRELDKKTLQTLKSWKFYPGQEGWVEIPFRWDLVGGPKEMPTTLRRSGMAQKN